MVRLFLNIDFMYFIFLLKTAFEDFKRNKVRTFLASLGIMIGVLSVVMLIAIGIGLKNYLKEQFENLGSNLIIIFPGNVFSGEEGAGGSFGAGFAGGAQFDERDYFSLQRLKEADYVVPSFTKSSIVENESERYLGYVIGTNEEYFDLLNLEIDEGKLFDKADVLGRAKKGVLGSEIAEKLFTDAKSAIGQTVNVGNQRYKIIGVNKKKGDREADGSLVVPYKSTFGTLNPEETFFAMYLGVADENNVEKVKQEAEEILLKRYEEDDFSVTEQTEILETVNQIFSVVNYILIAIGSISLVVGGIGIMNIMYANVTERTKEIGIRRAIGATRKDVLFQFLAESTLLSLFGGLMGLGISIVLVLLIRPFFPVGINLFATSLALGISSFIGIFFGVFPANKASKLTPIEAIRYE